MKIKFLVLSLFINFLSCTHAPLSRQSVEQKREIANQAQSQQMHPLLQIAEKAEQTLGQIDQVSADSCKSQLQNLMNTIKQINLAEFNKVEGQSELASVLPQLREKIFTTRLLVKERFKTMPATTKLSCLSEIRRMNSYLRTAEEIVGEWMIEKKLLVNLDSEVDENDVNTDSNSKNDKKIKPFAPEWTMVNPAYGELKFQPGDVILDRGDANLSALIARIGDTETLFSHLLLVGQDQQGQLYAVEILTDSNLKATPLEKWLSDEGDARMAVYRARDTEVAIQAARRIYDKVIETETQRKPIRYDFHMNDRERRTLFCSEVVQWAYELTDQKWILPQHKTTAYKFSTSDFRFLKEMKINEKEFFAPIDIEFDSRFELVAEFRNYPMLREMRMQDASLTAVYEWMNSKKYFFTPLFEETYFKALLAKTYVRFGGQISGVAAHMPRQALRMSIKVDILVDELVKRMDEFEEKYFDEHGVPLSYWQMLAFLEDYRTRDCRKENLSDNTEKSLHYFFSPHQQLKCQN